MEVGAIPGFALDGGIALALARGLSVAGLLGWFGALLFRVALAPPVLAGIADGGAAWERRWRGLAWGIWWATLAATLGWLVMQTASMAGAQGVAATVAAIPDVVFGTRFGHLLLLRLALLVGAALLLRGGGHTGPWAATIAAGLATASQAGHGHAAAMHEGPSLLLGSEVVHLLAAGAWLGGLPPLLLMVAHAPADAAARAARRFSPLGIVCVALVAATAWFQYDGLVGGIAGLVGTGYGLVALLKLAGFAVAVALAARHRDRLVPALAAGGGEGDARRLARSIGVETAAGLLVVLLAGLLTSLPPAMHTQPLWPFPLRASLDTIREDAETRREVVAAGLALAAAAGALATGLLVRRVRWVALAAAGTVAWIAAPHLRVLLVEAYPTSFYVSPTGFSAASIVAGVRLYPEHCAACHGATGRGDGPLARGLAVPPADLTAAHLWMHDDGTLFWWLSHGIDAPEGGQSMPGFAAVLPDDARWALIDYVRANNAGRAMLEAGTWPRPLQAPDLDVTCDGRSLSLRDLRGRFVRLSFGAAPKGGGTGVVDVVVGGTGAAATCAATGDDALAAYATMTGLAAPALRGAQLLIDREGWARALHPRGAPDSWDDPRLLAAAISDLSAHPVAAASGGMDMPM